MPDPAIAIEIGALRKSYRARRGEPTRPALDGVSLTVPRAQRVALLGPNGSGKSTLLKLLSLAIAPDSGSLRALGFDLGALSASSRRGYLANLGVVFQNPSLDSLLTVAENLRTQAALVGISDPRAVIDDLARRLDFGDRLHQRIRTLSGGLIRRVDLARAVMHRPALLLLDEPTTGLDPAARAAFLSLVDDLSRAGDMTVLMSTHLIDEAERADRVIMLSAGRIVADDSPMRLRDALGGWVLRPHRGDSAESITRLLSDAGLVAAAHANGEPVFTCPRDQPNVLERAAATLTRERVPFEVGPPDLGDAYLAATGQRIAPGGGADA